LLASILTHGILVSYEKMGQDIRRIKDHKFLFHKKKDLLDKDEARGSKLQSRGEVAPKKRKMVALIGRADLES